MGILCVFLGPGGDLGLAVLRLVASDGQTGDDGSPGAGGAQILLAVGHAAALVGAQGDAPGR